MTHRLRLAGAFAITAALLLGACGTSGGSDADKKSDDTSTEATDTNSDTSSDVSSDVSSDGTDTDEPTSSDTNDDAQARADAVDLTVSDFPDGWEASPPEPEDPDNPLAKCDPSFAEENDTSIASHKTDQFSIGSIDEGNGAQFSAETKVFESETDAKAAIDPLTEPDVISCLDRTLKELFGDGQDATVTGELTHDSGDIGADQAEQLIADYTIEANDGSSAQVSVGILAIRTGDIATMATGLGIGDMVQDIDLSDQVGKIVALQKG
jgi:hypothetical protein